MRKNGNDKKAKKKESREAEIRQQNNRYLSKTFFNKGSASAWAKDTENKLEKEQYEDFKDSAHITLD